MGVIEAWMFELIRRALFTYGVEIAWRLDSGELEEKDEVIWLEEERLVHNARAALNAIQNDWAARQAVTKEGGS